MKYLAHADPFNNRWTLASGEAVNALTELIVVEEVQKATLVPVKQSIEIDGLRTKMTSERSCEVRFPASGRSIYRDDVVPTQRMILERSSELANVTKPFLSHASRWLRLTFRITWT